MQYKLLVAGLLAIVIVTSYSAPHFVQAQTNTIEKCDSKTCNVKITKDGFVPKSLTVTIGTTIIWTNTDNTKHTVTSGSPGEIIQPLKSKMLDTNDTYAFTFEYGGLYKGKYPYFDQITEFLRGEIIVEPETETTGTPTKAQTISVDFNDPNSGVKKVSLSSGTIKSMDIDTTTRSLIISLSSVQTNGNLEITLDRNLIDANSDGSDAHFTVLTTKISSPENEGLYDEISSTSSDRTLRIVVPETATQIRIVGTHVVPEFPIAMLAIAGVFTTMIAAYRLRNKF